MHTYNVHQTAQLDGVFLNRPGSVEHCFMTVFHRILIAWPPSSYWATEANYQGIFQI